MNRKKHKPKKPFDPGAFLENLPTYRATIETIKSPNFIEIIKEADVVLTFPTSPEWNPQIAYGKRTLERIASGIHLEFRLLAPAIKGHVIS